MTWDGLVQQNGKYRSIRRMEYPEFQTGIFGQMESALGIDIINILPTRNRELGASVVRDGSWVVRKKRRLRNL